MSTKRTIDIDINTNADQAAKQFDTLATGVKKAADSADNLDAKFEDVFQGIEPLTTRLGEAEDRLYELALAGDTTSKEYQELLKRVAEYRKVQIQTDLAVDQAAQTFSQKLGTAITGATSGFAAVQGAMGLVGVESETLEKTLLKVQSALALQQGVQGVLDYTKSIGLAGKATKVFNLIVKGNPLALFATALVAIISSLAIFTDAIDIAIKKLKSITDFLGLTNFAEQELEAERKKRHEAELKRKKAEDEAAKKAEAAAKKQAEEEKRLLAERLAAFKEYAANRLAAARRIQDLELEIMDEGIQKELAANKLRFDRLIEDTKKNTELTAKERKRITEIFLFQQQEAENEIRNKFRQEQLQAEDEFQVERLDKLVNETGQMQLDALKKQANDEIEIAREKNKKLEELDELSADRKRELAVGAATDTFTTIANLAELFAGESKEQQKKAFKVQKAANIAQATVDTFSSAIAAYKSQASIPVVGPVLGGIAAAAAVSAGLLNIKKISQQRFESGGGTDGGGADFAPSGGGAQAPQFNVVGDSGINQLASLQQPVQAFVVSGEVTTAQALDRNRVQNATL